MPRAANRRVAAYFLALGLAFLFVEIAFIQKFILFLGHPLYAVAVVLTGFLLFAGVGSGISSWFAERVDAWHRASPVHGPRLSAIELSIIGIIALSLFYVLISAPHIHIRSCPSPISPRSLSRSASSPPWPSLWACRSRSDCRECGRERGPLFLGPGA